MPLTDKRIVITRPESQASEFLAMLRAAGAAPVLFPTIAIEPVAENADLDTALAHFYAYDWLIFTSVNGVRAVLARMQALNLAPDALNACRIAVIGPATAAALREYSLHVDLQPDEYIAEAVVEALLAKGRLEGQRFLLLRADIARAVLREQLTAHGAVVDEIPVYRTVRGQPEAAAYAALRAGVDVITFTSSSTVRYFFELLGDAAAEIAARAVIACIGPITAQTAREFGLHVDLVADEYTVPGLLNALEERMRG